MQYQAPGEESLTVICDGCGKLIYKTATKIPGKHYCGRQCYEKTAGKVNDKAALVAAIPDGVGIFSQHGPSNDPA